MTELTIEQELYNCYVDAYPGDDHFAELPNSPLQAALSAPPVEEALMDIYISDKDLYYAFLGEAMRQQGKENLDNNSDLMELNRHVVNNMWKNNMDYFRIIRCLTYTPMDEGKSLRYMNAVLTTTQCINPVLSLPNYVAAKPIHQLNPMEAMSDDKIEETYTAYAKTVLMKNPSLRIKEVDREVVRLLKKADASDREVEKALWAGSPQFIHSMETDIEVKVRISERLKAFLAETLPEVKKEKPMSMMDIEPYQSDYSIYQNMQEKIRNMKGQHESGDGFAYWENAIKIMQETLNKLNEFQHLSKVVSILSVGMERAAKEFDMEMNPEFQQIRAQAASLSKQIESRQQDWSALRETANKTVLLSTKLIQELHKKRDDNPLLQLPEVQHAISYEAAIKDKSTPPDKLYFATLKEIVKTYPGILASEADVVAVQKLQKAGRENYQIAMGLTYSPSFRNLDSQARMTAVQSLVQQVGGQSRGGMTR